MADDNKMDKLTQQFDEGDRVLVTATRQLGTVVRVIPKNMDPTGEPDADTELFVYEIMLDEDGSMTTLYEGIEALTDEDDIVDDEESQAPDELQRG